MPIAYAWDMTTSVVYVSKKLYKPRTPAKKTQTTKKTDRKAT